MTDPTTVIHDRSVLICDSSGPPIARVQDALDIIGEAWGQRALMVAIPVSRLGSEFFDLSSGLAGDVIQKFVNYELQLVIIGPIKEHLKVSSALRAFVHESNNGSQVWFLDGVEDLEARLARQR
jgi:hypothetical protein